MIGLVAKFILMLESHSFYPLTANIGEQSGSPYMFNCSSLLPKLKCSANFCLMFMAIFSYLPKGKSKTSEKWIWPRQEDVNCAGSSQFYQWMYTNLVGMENSQNDWKIHRGTDQIQAALYWRQSQGSWTISAPIRELTPAVRGTYQTVVSITSPPNIVVWLFWLLAPSTQILDAGSVNIEAEFAMFLDAD